MTAEQAEHLRLAQIARETFARETGERVAPLRDFDSLPDWLLQLRARGRQAVHEWGQGAAVGLLMPTIRLPRPRLDYSAINPGLAAHSIWE
jgi:hypothetical protein